MKVKAYITEFSLYDLEQMLPCDPSDLGDKIVHFAYNYAQAAGGIVKKEWDKAEEIEIADALYSSDTEYPDSSDIRIFTVYAVREETVAEEKKRMEKTKAIREKKKKQKAEKKALVEASEKTLYEKLRKKYGNV